MIDKIELIKVIRSVSVIPENIRVEETAPCPHCGYVDSHLDLKSARDIADKIEANTELLKHKPFTITVRADDAGNILLPILIGGNKITTLGIHKIDGDVFCIVKEN